MDTVYDSPLHPLHLEFSYSRVLGISKWLAIVADPKLQFSACYSQLRSSLGLWLQYLLLMGCQGPRQFNSKHVVRIHSLLNYVLTALSCGAQRGGCKDKQAGICHIWGLTS